MCKFTNPARSDKLVLSHWERINVSSKAVSNDEVLPVYDEQNIVRHEYRFAKFNPVIKVYRYSDEFYNSHLKVIILVYFSNMLIKYLPSHLMLFIHCV